MTKVPSIVRVREGRRTAQGEGVTCHQDSLTEDQFLGHGSVLPTDWGVPPRARLGLPSLRKPQCPHSTHCPHPHGHRPQAGNGGGGGLGPMTRAGEAAKGHLPCPREGRALNPVSAPAPRAECPGTGKEPQAWARLRHQCEPSKPHSCLRSSSGCDPSNHTGHGKTSCSWCPCLPPQMEHTCGGPGSTGKEAPWVGPSH